MGGSARLLVGVLVLVAFSAGCSSCADAGCDDNLTVSISITAGEADASLEPGVYVFEVTSDVASATATCAFDPTLPCECVVDEGSYIYSGGGCTAEGSLSLTVSLYNPRSVSLRAMKDGVEFDSRDGTPRYNTVMPNGAGCTPTCTQAQPLTFAL
jgi:hypothetical protein